MADATLKPCCLIPAFIPITMPGGFIPNNPDFIIDGNDGGIGISRDRGKTWVFDEKIPFGQFYHINVDNEIPYNVMGGMQDNGSWHGPGL